jgi:hypothetical protein
MMGGAAWREYNVAGPSQQATLQAIDRVHQTMTTPDPHNRDSRALAVVYQPIEMGFLIEMRSLLLC